jgi:uncharacterized protein (DUF1697 family)
MGAGLPVKRVAALMRAVNVGGTGALPMAQVREMLADAGFDKPETLLASGNAVIGTDLSPEAAERRFEQAIETRFAFRTDVLVRDLEQLQAVVAANPFEDFARETPNLLIVYFLRGEPDGELASLEPYCVFGEKVAAGPGCLYLAYPNGSGTSKLSGAAIERKLKVRGTGRNWNTVRKLVAKLGGQAQGG